MAKQMAWVAGAMLALAACQQSSTEGEAQRSDPLVQLPLPGHVAFARPGNAHVESMFSEGQRIFRFDTFGDENFWGDTLQLNQAIAGERNGGVGRGLSPAAALKVGLKVDATAVPAAVATAIQAGQVDLNDPANTLLLLQVDAVVGVKGVFKDNKLTSVGITCALCHSTVDNSFAPGIGKRLDGWPNRDLNVGAIIAMAPKLTPFSTALGVSDETVRQVLHSWGPGKYDAELLLDGKAIRPDGKPAATLLPAAFGLTGVNLHTYTGWGSVPYWNAFVANTQMQGMGVFYDPRLNDPKFPVAQRLRLANIRHSPDQVTAKLPALQFYQLSLETPTPPSGSFDVAAAQRGRAVFEGRGQCASCHVPPLFTEPGWQMHTAAEIGIDDFQAMRSPDGRYRTTPLKGLFTRLKGGLYHDGRFADLGAVVDHYNRHLQLNLTAAERTDLIEYLKSI
jgi:hypothetical protein